MQTSSVSHRGAVCFSGLLQVMVVGQDLHQEVQLQSLRLKESKRFNNSTFPSGLRACHKRRRVVDLGPLALHAPHTARAVHHRVLRHDLTGVDLAAGPDDAAAGEDHISAQVGWRENDAKTQRFWFVFLCVAHEGKCSPLDSITLLSPIFKA